MVHQGHPGGDALRPQRLRGRSQLLPPGAKQSRAPGAVAGTRRCGDLDDVDGISPSSESSGD